MLREIAQRDDPELGLAQPDRPRFGNGKRRPHHRNIDVIEFGRQLDVLQILGAVNLRHSRTDDLGLRQQFGACGSGMAMRGALARTASSMTSRLVFTACPYSRCTIAGTS